MNQFIIECTRASGAKSALNYLQKADPDLSSTVIPDKDHSWGLDLDTDWYHHFFINTILNKQSLWTLINKNQMNEEDYGSIVWSYTIVQIKD